VVEDFFNCRFPFLGWRAGKDNKISWPFTFVLYVLFGVLVVFSDDII